MKICDLPEPSKEVKKVRKTELGDLPNEILFNILARLPITCLLQAARYACKLWHSVIYDPLFSEFHLVHTHKNHPGFIYALDGVPGLYFMDPPHKELGMKILGERIDKEVKNSVSCNGLLCYQSTKKRESAVCMYNPITGDGVEILIPSRCGIPITWGFGYAKLSKKFKYVHLWGDQNGLQLTQGAIFTLGDDESSWRQLPIPSSVCSAVCDPVVVYCNGALFWNTRFSMYECVSFDIETEEFRVRWVIPCDSGPPLFCSPTYLTVLGENVAFVVDKDESCIVWVLMDEAMDIWEKKYVIDKPIEGRNIFWIRSRHRVDDEEDHGHKYVEYTLSGHWMDDTLCGMMRGVARPRFLSYDVPSRQHEIIRLPFNDDADFKRSSSSPRLVMTHTGSFISPSRIVAMKMHQ